MQQPCRIIIVIAAIPTIAPSPQNITSLRNICSEGFRIVAFYYSLLLLILVNFFLNKKKKQIFKLLINRMRLQRQDVVEKSYKYLRDTPMLWIFFEVSINSRWKLILYEIIGI